MTVKKPRREKRRWKPAAEPVARIHFFSSEKQTRPARLSIDKSRKDDGPDRCFRQRGVRPCALISNGFTEGPAADDAGDGRSVLQVSPTPSPYFRREYITGVAVFCRDVSLRNTRHHRFLFSPVRPFRLHRNPLSPSSCPSWTDNRRFAYSRTATNPLPRNGRSPVGNGEY